MKDIVKQNITPPISQVLFDRMNLDPLADVAPDWTPYRYGFNNPVKYIDPDGLFESRSDAKGWANENNIKTGFFRNHKIRNHDDGSWSVDNRKEGVTYYRGSDLDDANVLGRRSDGVIETVLLSNKEYNAFTSTTSDIWNSPIARTVVPDKLALSFSSSATAFIGFNKDLTFNWITRGHDASVIPYPTFSVGGQAGGKVMADALIGIGVGYYATTDMRSLKYGEAAKTLLGWNVDASIGVGIGPSGSAKGSVSFKDPLNLDFTPTWIQVNLGVGAGIGAGG